MADLNITITDAPRSAITVASPGPQGPAGAGLSPIADDRLLGNVSGSTATPSALTASQVKDLLDYVATADLQAALANSPALGGTPTAPTASVGTNTTQIATTEFVQYAITGSRAGEIPSLRPGVSVLFEERFSSNTGFSANWDSVENNSLVKGGVATGPRLKTNGTGDEFRFAFCVKKPTAVENSAGYSIPQAAKALPSTGFATISFFFRPGFFHTFLPTQGAVLCHTRDQFNNPNTFLGVEITKDSESFVRFRSGPYYSPETSDWFPVGEWYRVGMALDIDGKKSKTFIKRMYDDQVI